MLQHACSRQVHTLLNVWGQILAQHEKLKSMWRSLLTPVFLFLLFSTFSISCHGALQVGHQAVSGHIQQAALSSYLLIIQAYAYRVRSSIAVAFAV
eukprot:364980-Chlamydomonas_euryale.AAC.13